jgi:uncharacterized protein YndB with AHSA1/START domain
MDPKGEQTAFVYTTYIQQTPERVWQGLTDPALMKRYWRHQTAGPKTFHSDWTKGSAYQMAHDDVGLVVSGPGQVIRLASSAASLRTASARTSASNR